MNLPTELKSKIQELLHSHPLNKIIEQSAVLSSLYRDARNEKRELAPLASHYQRLAYLLARMPATFAVVVSVLKNMAKLCGNVSISSLLDIGAGPGTALWGAVEVFPSLSQATLIERDKEFIRLGKSLAEGLESIDIEWKAEDLKDFSSIKPHDLVIASYSLGELKEDERLKVLESLWTATNQFLIIIEPGTPFGFSQVKQIREFLISKEAYLLAPCPHASACPMQGNDWCHFSARVERSSEHRKIKQAKLNYEDEKFSYLIFSKNQIARCHERILRTPFHGSGFVKLQVCSNEQLCEKTITKKSKEEFKYSKKLNCGDFN